MQKEILKADDKTECVFRTAKVEQENINNQTNVSLCEKTELFQSSSSFEIEYNEMGEVRANE